MSDLVWARDRATGKVEQHEVSFLDAWPADYYRLAEPPKTKKSSARSASNVPAEGTNLEGGA